MANDRTAYSEKLRDPRWQKRRLGVLERDGWTCRFCGATTKTLTVHHRWYVPGFQPWDYPDSALVTLCEDCHQLEYETRAIAEQDILMSFRLTDFTAWDLKNILAEGVARLAMVNVPTVVAAALSHLFQDPQAMTALVEEHLRAGNGPGQE